MPTIEISALSEDLPFGARIRGVDEAALRDEAVRERIRAALEASGLLVFEEMEPSGELQLALRDVLGPAQEHAMPAVPKAGALPGVMELNHHPGQTDVLEVDGRLLSGWTNWHWDACYTKEIYRGAVLRALVIPPEGGMTGFADGVQLYKAISPEMRGRFERLDIVYHPRLMLMEQRFGMPRQVRLLKLSDRMAKVFAEAENAPRGVHPAVWTRSTGEKVLHVSPWQAAGIFGDETPEGDALLEALIQEMYAKMTPYWHRWKPTDMVVWDNWRMMHCVSGHSPEHGRRIHRATIKGDYGLGRFEAEALEGVG